MCVSVGYSYYKEGVVYDQVDILKGYKTATCLSVGNAFGRIIYQLLQSGPSELVDTVFTITYSINSKSQSITTK